MVVGAFPAAKLGALLLKQISKPIANVVKEQAKSSPVFRKYVCMPPAQFYNWCEVKAKMWILNLGKPVNIPVLNEAMAIELGANLLGEGLIFIIAAGILISEYTRSSRKEAAKEEAKRQEMIQIRNSMKELFIQAEEQGAHIRELTRKLGELDTKLGLRNAEGNSPSEVKQNLKDTAPSSGSRVIIEREVPDDVSNNIDRLDNFDLQNCKYITSDSNYPPSGLILRAIAEVENEFLNSPAKQREDGILTLSLRYVSKDIFRI